MDHAIGAVTLLSLSACAASASNLKPAAVAQGEGALFGRVHVLNHGEDVTSSCYCTFSDAEKSPKSRVSLDETGWVFATVRRGPTWLTDVTCTLGGLIKYNATFATDRLAFGVPGGGKIAYFGNIEIELNADGDTVVAGTLIGGAVGAIIATADDGSRPAFIVENRFDEARAEYRTRYGAQAALLTPRASIAGPGGARP